MSLLYTNSLIAFMMGRFQIIALLALVAAAVASSGCPSRIHNADSHDPLQDECDHAKSKSDEEPLVVLEGATKITVREGAFCSHQVSYLLNESYPATGAIRRLSSALEERGWKPSDEELLNSDVREWRSFRDTIRGAPMRVHQWRAEWWNESGDLVMYGLRYYAEPGDGTEDLTTLAIIGVWTPAEGVKAEKELLDRALPDFEDE